MLATSGASSNSNHTQAMIEILCSKPFSANCIWEKSPDLESCQAPKLPCFVGPTDKHQQFFGRENVLVARERALCPSPSEVADPNQPQHVTYPRAFALRGSGGIGKTRIAAEFAIRFKDRFDAVFWVHADNSAKLAHDFRAATLKIGLASKESADAQDHKFTRDLLKR